jgi:hypothetical protein
VWQVMLAARKRMDERRARETAARAHAEAEAGMRRISEPEKTFTSQVAAPPITTRQWCKGCLVFVTHILQCEMLS